jgi:hypothetical protein
MATEQPIYVLNLVVGTLTAMAAFGTPGSITVDGTLTVSGASTFNGPAALADGATLGGILDADGNAVQNLPAPVNPDDAATKAYVDASSGSHPAGPTTAIQYNASGIFGGDANLTWDSGTQVLTVTGALTTTGATSLGPATLTGGATLGGILDADGNAVQNLPAPVNPDDAATKAYVDASSGSHPAGPATAIQYNASGIFGGDANLTWVTGTQTLAVAGATPAVIIGSTTADPGAALQLKSDAGTGALAFNAAAASPSRLSVQSRTTTTGAVTAVVQTLELADQTSAYCDLVLAGVVTAGTLGQTNTFHRRFRLTRYDAGGGTTLSAITDDFTEIQTTGADILFTIAGSTLQVGAQGVAGATLTWDATASLYLTQAW